MHSDRIFIAKTLKKYVRLGLLGKRMSEYARISIIKGVAKNERELYDLVAVSDMLKVLYATDRKEELSAFIALYMSERGMRIVSRQNDVSTRALRFALKNHLDVRTVYRRAAYIEALYLKIRSAYDELR